MSPEFLASTIIVLLLSVILHEVAHGLMALRFGDTTAQRAGRLTLNPLPHVDLIGTILLPALFIIPPILAGLPPGPVLAWAKPVPVNPLNFSNLRRGELLVSAAGILTNFGLAIICTLFYHLLVALAAPVLIVMILRVAITINLLLGIFNLFPIPPLDGSKVLLSLLPYNLAKQYDKLTPYGFFILLALLFIPAGNGSLIGLILGIFIEIFETILGLN